MVTGVASGMVCVRQTMVCLLCFFIKDYINLTTQ